MIAEIIDSKTIHVFDKSQFDWYAIRNCGQSFRDPPCDIIEQSDKIVIKATGNKNSDWLWNYFDLDTDYNEIKKQLSQFNVLSDPMRAGYGIRILRQPFTETVISFIVSANNNIKRFTKTLAQIDFEHLEKYSEEDFVKMGCGYRAPYLIKTIKRMKDFHPTACRKELMTLAGVGPKVADCILLFAFHCLDVAPIDTHIRKSIEQLGKEEADKIYSHKYAGVAQQYIFYYLQHLHKKLN